jgi:N-acetylglucosaminyldiphosphoundecaprenol N-acetyl-beta-D-mannosaminyltransferase
MHSPNRWSYQIPPRWSGDGGHVPSATNGSLRDSRGSARRLVLDCPSIGLADRVSSETREVTEKALGSATVTASSARPIRATLIAGIPIFDGSLDDAAKLCVGAITARSGARVATANLDFFARARRDATLRDDLSDSTLVTADGAPVAWLARLNNADHTRRVTGVDLIARICELSPTGHLRVATVGSTPEVVEAAVHQLEAGFTSVRVVETIFPPFRDQTADERETDLARLCAASPNLVLVALGCPKQERFIRTSFDRVPQAVWIGVGGSLDFFAGRRKRAPWLLRAIGAEWVVRLVQEPRRLWKRYLVNDLVVFFALLLSAVNSQRDGRKTDRETASP